MHGLIIPTSISFEYGTTPAMGNSVFAAPGNIADTGAYTCTGMAVNLLPATQYYYRMVGNTISGSVLYSNVLTFYSGVPANNFQVSTSLHVTNTEAQLKGRVSGFHFPVQLSFEYGTSETFGSEVAASPASVNDSLSHEVSAQISGLDSTTFYYYRLKAVNSQVTYYSNTRKLHTRAFVPNWDFQNWDLDTTLIPLHWNLVGTSVERVAGNSGGYALKLFGRNFTILGMVADGGGHGNGPLFYGGEPFSSRPDSINVLLNYYLTPGDTAMLMLALYNDTNVIAKSFYTFGGNSSGAFETLSFPISYNSPLIPDSVVLGLTTFNPSQPQSAFADDNYIIADEITFTPSAPPVFNADFEQWFLFNDKYLPGWSYPRFILVNPQAPDENKMVNQGLYNGPDDYAAELTNVKWAGRWSTASMSFGKDEILGNSHGFPIAGRHEVLTGYYKYIPENNDTAAIEVYLLKNRQPVGVARFYLSDTVSEFTPFEMMISYMDSLIPDTAVMEFRADNGRASGGSVLTIDKLNFDGFRDAFSDTTGIIPQNLKTGDEVKIYPNPAHSGFIVELGAAALSPSYIRLLDINGRVVRQQAFAPGQSRLGMDVTELDAGFYLVSVTTSEQVYTKKIIVAR